MSKESSEIFKGCVRQSCACAGKKISYIFVEKKEPTVNLIKGSVELTSSEVAEINKYLIESNFKWVPHK
jgi:hypothetical protein